MALRLRHGRLQTGRVGDPGDPDGGTSPGGFYEDRETEPRDLGEHGLPFEAQSALRGDDVGADGQPRRLEGQFHEVFVHAHCGGQHTRPDITDAHHLEHSLDGAVLAVGAVQEGEDDIHRLHIQQLVADPGGDLAPAVTDQPDRVVFGFRNLRCGSPGDVEIRDLLQRHPGPPAAPRDADGDDVEPFPVDGSEHAGRRQTGDAVLRRFSSENQGDLDPFRHWGLLSSTAESSYLPRGTRPDQLLRPAPARLSFTSESVSSRW